MTDEQRELLVAAHESLQAAELLLSNGYSGFAAARAYYAMFYVAEACLEGKGLAFSKHSAVIAAFGKEFAATERAPREFHRFLIEAMEDRQKGDYPAGQEISAETASTHISRAREVLAWAERVIGSTSA
jgi:uncharacterized protein (UPF0332 family)